MTTAVPLGFSGLWTVIQASAFSNLPSPIGALPFHSFSRSGSSFFAGGLSA
jgi:hypothetical protein